jgi:hypothetical protein
MIHSTQEVYNESACGKADWSLKDVWEREDWDFSWVAVSREQQRETQR